MKAVVAAFNQEKALVGAYSVIIHHRRLTVYSTIQEVLVRSLYPIHYINCPDSLYCNENNTLIIVQHSCGLLKYQLRQKIINHCCVFTPTCHGWIFCHKMILSLYLLFYLNTHSMKTKIYENYCPKMKWIGEIFANEIEYSPLSQPAGNHGWWK